MQDPKNKLTALEEREYEISMLVLEVEKSLSLFMLDIESSNAFDEVFKMGDKILNNIKDMEDIFEKSISIMRLQTVFMALKNTLQAIGMEDIFNVNNEQGK